MCIFLACYDERQILNGCAEFLHIRLTVLSENILSFENDILRYIASQGIIVNPIRDLYRALFFLIHSELEFQ